MITAIGLLAACSTPPSAATATPAAEAAAAPTATPALADTATLTQAESLTETEALTEVPEITEAAGVTEAAVPAALPTVTPQAEAQAAGAAPPDFDPDQMSLGLEVVAEGLSGPLFVTPAGDGSGRLFIVEKPGLIHIVADGQIVQPAFLDLTDRVRSSGSEQGLLGLAFDPNYPETGYFWVNYTDRNGNTVVSRFHTAAETPDQADPASEFVTLQVDQPAANHNGGMVLFGPDGYLWVGMGDGGGANDRFGNAQNPATLLGKMLRLDVTGNPDVPYMIPADNPWVEADWNGADVVDEAWALGLRNPWRFSFDRATGDLWIADVGQNQYEEINVTPAGSPGGLNFGWPIMEGMRCFQSADCSSDGLVMPVAEYDHSGHCSVTGGYVYRGSAFPALNGVYLFADYCSGALWATVPEGDGWATYPMLQTGIMVSSFGEDEAGEVYVTDLAGGGVYRLVVQ
ncbi:MAG: PQQ-dependent sugar dehydrogenase [Caldilineaceae bacterium]|nr:PQQ-dependent sugar dehydrogenase [Caldilineaceae bacterium]